VLLAGLALAAAAPPARPDDVPLSPAQILLFDTPHLKAIGHPVSLEYSFHRNGPAAFDDLVVERLMPSPAVRPGRPSPGRPRLETQAILAACAD
jgi:hypothetical protein